MDYNELTLGGGLIAAGATKATGSSVLSSLTSASGHYFWAGVGPIIAPYVAAPVLIVVGTALVIDAIANSK